MLRLFQRIAAIPLPFRGEGPKAHENGFPMKGAPPLDIDRRRVSVAAASVGVVPASLPPSARAKPSRRGPAAARARLRRAFLDRPEPAPRPLRSSAGRQCRAKGAGVPA